MADTSNLDEQLTKSLGTVEGDESPPAGAIFTKLKRDSFSMLSEDETVELAHATRQTFKELAASGSLAGFYESKEPQAKVSARELIVDSVLAEQTNLAKFQFVMLIADSFWDTLHAEG